MESGKHRFVRAVSRHKRIFTVVITVLVIIVFIVVFEYEYVPSFSYESNTHSISYVTLGASNKGNSRGNIVYWIGNETSTAFMNQSGHSSYLKLHLGRVGMQEFGSSNFYYYAFASISVSGHLFSDLHPKGITISLKVNKYNYPLVFQLHTFEGVLDNLTPSNAYGCAYFQGSHSGTEILCKFNNNNVTYFDFSGNYYNFALTYEYGITTRIHGVSVNSTQPSNLTVSISANILGLGRPVSATAEIHLTIWHASLLFFSPVPNMKYVKNGEIFIKDLNNGEIWTIKSSVFHSDYSFRFNAIPYSNYLIYYLYINGTEFEKNITSGPPGGYIQSINITG
jgi:hypothetical protein